MRKIWDNIRTTITDAIRNTPVEVILAILLAIAMSVAIEGDGGKEVARFFATSFLALCAIFATSASHALRVFDRRTRWLLTLMFGGGIAAYGALVLNVETTTELWRWAFLAIAAVMGVMLVPVAAKMGDVSASERFWRYNIRLFSRVTVAYAYGIALFAGVAVGIAAIDGLFELSIDGEIYGHLFAWIVVGLSTILAVGSLGEIKRIGEAFAPETLVWSGRLGTFLFMPLVVLYLGIMYVYLIKVAVTGVVPSNILSPLALGAGILGYFGLFVLQPHMHREDFKPLAAVLRAFPAAFVPIVPFGIWAVGQRVDQYGWTEFRYARMAALVCLGVFSLAGAYKWLRKREFSLVTGPAILGVVALLGAVGPWGASYVSRVSQTSRLNDALKAAAMLDERGHMVSKDQFASASPSEDLVTIRETSEYLLEAHGDEALSRFTLVDLSAYSSRSEKLQALGVQQISDVYTTRYLYSPRDQAFHLPRGGDVTDFSVAQYNAGDVRGISLRLDGQDLVVKRGRVEGRASLRFTEGIQHVDNAGGEIDASEAVRQIVSANGTVIGAVGVRDLNLEPDGDGYKLSYASGIIVLY